MIEVLPIRLLVDEDTQIFGSLNSALGKLSRVGLPVGLGIVITPPFLKLKTTLEHYDFGTKEIFEQSLTLVKKELHVVPVPDILKEETKKHKNFLLLGVTFKSTKELWKQLLEIWIDQIKLRLWKEGFYKGITEGLEPQVVIFIKKVQSLGFAYFDSLLEDTVINIKKGKPHPNDLKKIDELVREANKKLFIPHEYEWVVDGGGVKIIKVSPYIFHPMPSKASIFSQPTKKITQRIARSAVKVFFDLSQGFIIEKDIDGVYISSEKIFDLNKPQQSFENLVFKLVESALTYPSSPILFKLADKSEGMGKVRGSLRLLHQKSLFEPLIDAISFARHKKGLTNIHIVIPYIRTVSEFLQIKRELSTKKLMRKTSLQLWMEAAVPENIINLEEYLVSGLDGVVLNLDELISHLNGFDASEQDLLFYKNEVKSLTKFLEDSLRLLHKSKIPFITYGSLSLYPQVLEFLIAKGVYGVVVEKYEVSSAKDLLYQTEKRLILRKS